MENEISGEARLQDCHDLTIDDLYAEFKRRLEAEAQEKLKSDWPTLGTQP